MNRRRQLSVEAAAKLVGVTIEQSKKDASGASGYLKAQPIPWPRDEGEVYNELGGSVYWMYMQWTLFLTAGVY